MAKTVIVDGVKSVAPASAAEFGLLRPGAEMMAVNFESGGAGLLDVSAPRARVWAEVIESMRDMRMPVYAEIDPDTSEITELLLPGTYTVESLAPTSAGDVEVRLIVSSALHYLRRGNPRFEQMLAALQTAKQEGSLVLVTETLDGNEIVDVQAAPAEAAPAPPAPAPEVAESPATLVSPADAQTIFNSLSAKTCNPSTTPAPCIPFLYPDDGCWGRAHEMCRLILAGGRQPKKVWIYGSLHVKSGNKPNCHIYWGWHVAPTLLVNLPGGAEYMVIDPSLFTEPVRPEHWKSVQGDPNASLVATDAEVFHRTSGGSITYDDASYTETNSVLAYYRNKLKVRSATDGPPPYNVCQADVYLRDNLQDTGAEPLANGGISASPDINHYRNKLSDPQGTLGSAAAKGQNTLFETVEIGQTNYIYLRLQNRGLAAAPVDADVYYGLPSTLPTPSSWTKIGSLTTPPVVPGELRVAGPLHWSNIPQKGHYCFVAVIGTGNDPKPSLSGISTVNDFYALIREHNNVTWKNFDTDDAFAGSFWKYEFWIQGWPRIAYLSDLEIDLSQLPAGGTAELRMLKRLVRGAAIQGLEKTGETALYATYTAPTHSRPAIRNMPLAMNDRAQATLSVTLPAAIPAGAYNLAMLQKVGGQEMGRVTKQLLVGDYPFMGNVNSREVHIANCVWAHRMSPGHRAAFRDVETALRQGYNGCRYCLPHLDTGENP